MTSFNISFMANCTECCPRMLSLCSRRPTSPKVEQPPRVEEPAPSRDETAVKVNKVAQIIVKKDPDPPTEERGCTIL